MIHFIPMIPFYIVLLSLLLAFTSLGQGARNAPQWFKGNLHAHSYWGGNWREDRSFPEDTLNYYRTNGYHFVSLTDHDIIQTDTKKWVEISPDTITAGALRRYTNTYGKGAETKTENDRSTRATTTYVRLKTIPELKRQFEQRGRFLIIPGAGLNAKSGSLTAHMNAVNIAETPPAPQGETIGEMIAAAAKSVAEQSEKSKSEMMLILNNPFARYFDVQVENLFAHPEIRFFEMGDIADRYDAHKDWYGNGKFWDVANAFRISAGHPALYAVNTDHAQRFQGGGYRGWVRVRAPELSAGAIVGAMNRGDFYASCGVELRNVVYDPRKGELTVAVEPKKGETYEIAFIVTRAGFERGATRFSDPAADRKPARRGNAYSDTIGVVAKTVSGTTATYTLQADDMYARAVVTSSKPKNLLVPSALRPNYDSAFTQPVGWQQWQERNKVKN